MAERYDELRPVDALWWEATERLVDAGDLRGRRVLDVGCGTGRLAAVLAERFACKVWGVDPSPEMLAVARGRLPRGVGLKRARAERLPFRDGWFERATMALVVHLVDRTAAFPEALRVLGRGGRLAILTFDPAHFPGYYLNRFFPSLLAVDSERFAPAEALRRELLGAGFEEVATERFRQGRTLDRETALQRIEGRHISTLRLIPAEEFEAGLERARRELPAEVAVAYEWLLVVASASNA